MRLMKNAVLVCLTIMALVIGIAVQPAGAAAGGGITIYVVPAIADAQILPKTSISTDYISNQISVVASPGEFEPASFVVRANSNVSSLLPVASDLSGSAGTIDSSNIDIRYVKVWWQAKPLSYVSWRRADQSSRVLFPELLVKDPDFVLRGDERGISDQNNYVKKTNGSYVMVSSGAISAKSQPSVSSWPIKDSATLLPVDIAAGTNQQLWVTVRVPEDSAAGNYGGTISLGSLGTISVNLTVLPIDLQPPADEHAVFAFINLVSDSSATIGYSKSEQQLRAELKNMYEHGVTAPIITTSSETSLRKMLQWMREIGFTTNRLYYNGLGSLMNVANSDSTRLATLKSRVQRIVSIAAQYGFTDVYIYGVDEAPASQRYLERSNYKTVHSAGAKVYVCGYTGTAAAIGDLLDLLVWPAAPSATEEAIMHSYGHEIMSYSNPMSGVEKPETYRRNYGLLLWQKDYDGGQSFAWQWVQGSTVWNDFGGATYRGEVFAYPTMNGVIDTLEWEGWREGADDMRYLSTLLKAIKQAKAGGKNTSAAEAWLAQLKSSDLTTRDLGAVRSQMVNYILSLSGNSSSDVTPPAITSIASSVVTSPSITATVTWSTNEQATSQVEYGKTSGLGLSTALDLSLVTSHSVTLTGLDAGSTYYFKVKSADASGNLAASSVRSFNTAVIVPSDEMDTVGCWSLDENTGTTAYDESGYGNNGTLKNGPVWTTGKYGSALSFDGVNDYVDCRSDSSLNTTDAFTVAAWVKTTKTGWNTIVRKVVYPYNGYWFGTTSYGYLYLAVYSNGTSRASTSSVRVNDGAWHHVVAAYDGARTVFYVDGTAVYARNWGSFMAVGSTSGQSLYLSSAGSDRFKGLMDEVWIWNRALSADEAKAL